MTHPARSGKGVVKKGEVEKKEGLRGIGKAGQTTGKGIEKSKGEEGGGASLSPL